MIGIWIQLIKLGVFIRHRGWDLIMLDLFGGMILYGEQIIGGHIYKVTRYDEQLRDSITNNTNAQELLLNIYRVMLTRAKKGLCIWFEDAETKKHFKEVCLLEE